MVATRDPDETGVDEADGDEASTTRARSVTDAPAPAPRVRGTCPRSTTRQTRRVEPGRAVDPAADRGWRCGSRPTPATEVVIAVVLVLTGTAPCRCGRSPRPGRRASGPMCAPRSGRASRRTAGRPTRWRDRSGRSCAPTCRSRARTGRPRSQRARFIGVDGPRWFLRGVLPARPSSRRRRPPTSRDRVPRRRRRPRRGRDGSARPDPAAAADARSTEEDRRRTADADDHPGPFERGPEITEIH